MLAAFAAAAATLVVGPGHPYAKPCQAIAAAQPGDVVQIDAAGNGTYDGDVCGWSTPGLTVEGINGRARIAAAGQAYARKAIWVLDGPDTTIRNVELSGAAVSAADGANGAALRVEGSADLTLVGSYLHDNQDGILAGAGADTDITIDSTELSHNGDGSGQTHNVYVGDVHSFTMTGSYSHDAVEGHLVKTRARTNNIMYNRLTGEGGTDSYELDVPNAGTTRVVGNVIEQGPNTGNARMITYGEEGVPAGYDTHLTVAYNTIVNDRGGGTAPPAVHMDPAAAAPAVVQDNIVVGTSTVIDQASATVSGTCTDGAGFVNRAAYDYHLLATSACRDAVAAGSAAPDQQYTYNSGHEARSVVGPAPDAGAFEWGTAPPPATTPPPATPGGGGAGTTPSTPTTSALTIGTKRVTRTGALRVTLRIATPGRISLRATAKIGRARVTYATRSVRAKRAGTTTITLKPTRSGTRTLRRHHHLTLTLTATLRPASGNPTTRHATLKLRRTTRGVRTG